MRHWSNTKTLVEKRHMLKDGLNTRRLASGRSGRQKACSCGIFLRDNLPDAMFCDWIDERKYEPELEAIVASVEICQTVIVLDQVLGRFEKWIDGIS